MIDNIIHTFFGNRHRFRHMTFDELSELYTSMMLRSLAMGMAGIFIPVYLYQHGYAIWQILFFFFVTVTSQAIFTIPAAKQVARIGPKHTILISYILQVAALTGLVYIESLYASSMAGYLLLAALYGLSNTMFFMAFHVNFSKVKHHKNGGSELGWLYIMERIGAVSGPLAGGVVAYLFAPEYTFVIAIFLMLLAALPLFLTREAVKVNQRISFKKLKIDEIKPDAISFSAITLENAVAIVIWPLFLGVIVFQGNPYIQLGSITSISILISILAARSIGKITDNKKGRQLLRFNASINAALHLFRPFTSGYPMALAINLVNDGVTPGYRMPYFKGMYDAADDHPGSRIVYVAILEEFGAVSRMLFFGLSALAAYFIYADRVFFAALFAVGSLSSLAIMLERYPALKPRRFKKL